MCGKVWTWKERRPFGSGPNPRRRQALARFERIYLEYMLWTKISPHLWTGLGTGSFSLGAPPPTMDPLSTSHLSSWPFCHTRRRIKPARWLFRHPIMLINKANLFQLMDHNDLYVLDLTPSLKTLAMMVVNRHGLSTEVLHFFSLIYRYSSLNLWFGYFEDFHAHCSF